MEVIASRTRPCRRVLIFCALSALTSGLANAGETQKLRYDAQGRLIGMDIEGGPNNGAQLSIQMDLASNRTRYVISNGAGGGCALTASADTEGSDEFTIYTYVERIGNCPDAISVDYSVENVSNGAPYGSTAWFGGFGLPTSGPIQPGEANPARRWIRVWSGYGTVAPGNPLVLRVNWRVTSANATLLRASSLITFRNSDCYC